MNIFYLDEDPVRCASYFYDKHKVKMILESAQMLCTAHHELLHEPDVPYKRAHVNHPSTVWVRESLSHYFWLYEHMLALGNEYTKRYGKKHLTITKCKKPLELAPINIPEKQFKQPPQCMPDEYKDRNYIKAYRQYYIGEKKRFAIYTGVDTPDFLC